MRRGMSTGYKQLWTWLGFSFSSDIPENEFWLRDKMVFSILLSDSKCSVSAVDSTRQIRNLNQLYI
jgi:hypothetical protein